METVQATLTCPKCGSKETAEIPNSACTPFYKCKSCGELIKSKEGECCVFCSYGDKNCPLKSQHG
jgi:hypothetical protein